MTNQRTQFYSPQNRNKPQSFRRYNQSQNYNRTGYTKQFNRNNFNPQRRSSFRNDQMRLRFNRYPQTINEVTEEETNEDSYEEYDKLSCNQDRPFDHLLHDNNNEIVNKNDDYNPLPYEREDIVGQDNLYTNNIINLLEIDKSKSRYIDGLIQAKKDKDMSFNYEIE